MKDELYLAEVFSNRMTPLLRARYESPASNFYSAAAAMEGRMFDNTAWEHPVGSDLIGWTCRDVNSPIVYLQPGNDRTTVAGANCVT